MPEIISRDEARKRGLTRYFTGKECKRGHISERRCGNGYCLKCDSENNDRDRLAVKRSTDKLEVRQSRRCTEPEIISRKDALAKGLKKYFTGQPCLKGHVAERRTLSPCECVECCRFEIKLPTRSEQARQRAEKLTMSDCGSGAKTIEKGIDLIKSNGKIESGWKITGLFCVKGTRKITNGKS